VAKGFLYRGVPVNHSQQGSHSEHQDDDGFGDSVFDPHHTVDILKGGAKKIGKFLKHNMHVPHHDGRQPPMFSPNGNDERKEPNNEMKKQVEDMRKLMQEMGQLLNTVVVRMHSEYATSSSAKAPFSESVLLESIAELKHCKDVLLGRLSINDYLQFLAENPLPSSTPAPVVENQMPSVQTEDTDPLAIYVKPLASPVTPPAVIASPSSSVRVISSVSPRTPAPIAKPVALSRPLSDAAREMLDSAEPDSSLFTPSPRGGSGKKTNDDDDFSRLKSDSVVANPLLADLLG
jgi:hypothetical protein